MKRLRSVYCKRKCKAWKQKLKKCKLLKRLVNNGYGWDMLLTYWKKLFATMSSMVNLTSASAISLGARI